MSNTNSIKLSIKGLVPAFKNNKMIVGKHLITKPSYQKRLKEIDLDIDLQLLAILKIRGGETWTALQQQSWIESSMPNDDCWKDIPEIVVKGYEGEEDKVEIEIERI